MKTEVTKHLAHYFSLTAILASALWGIYSFYYDPVFQTAIAVSLGIAFVMWGITHHHIHGDLHFKIVLEYIATAVLGVAVLLVIIWRP